MTIPVNVQDIVDALELQNDESAAFLDRETGEVHVISHEALRLAEDETGPGDQLSAREAAEFALAERILDSDQFVELPSARDVHEWRMMESFCYSIDDKLVREQCLGAIHGRGAFRYFKDTIAQHGLRDSWYAFRDEELRTIAIEWCAENEIAYATDQPANAAG